MSASWSPTQTMIAVGSPESWGIVASVTAPPGWALLGRDLADPEDYTIVTKLHSLTDEEKKKIKESTAKFVNGCKFYASEEGLAEIVEKSTPWYFAWEDTFEARARKKGNFENILTLLCGT